MKESEKTRVYVIEDDAYALKQIIAELDDVDWIAVAGEWCIDDETEEEVEKKIAEIAGLGVQYVIIDCELNRIDFDGIDLFERIRHVLPDVGGFLLTVFVRRGYLRRAAQADFDGYVKKPGIVAAIQHVHETGEKYLDPKLGDMAMQLLGKVGEKNPGGLTPREMQVAGLIGDGIETNNAISQELGISEGAIGRHVSDIYKKTGVETRGQLRDWAKEMGISYAKMSRPSSKSED